MQGLEFEQLHEFPCTTPSPCAIHATEYYIRQDPELGSQKASRKHLSETKAILHRVICLYSTLGCLSQVSH